MQPPEQGRASVFFRLLLVLPLMIVLMVVAIVAIIVTIISWFAALITGRVPDALQDFLVGYHRLMLNIEAYAYLLVPRWPGLPFEASEKNQVTLEVDHVKLNRAAVFFRIFLVIPAHILNVLLVGLLQIYVLIMWVSGVLTKKTPVALHQTVALMVRYATRTSCYYSLLTPTQPYDGGVFGDAAQAGPAEKPTSWAVVPAVRTLLILSMVGAVALPIIISIASGGSTQPTPY